MLRPAVNNHVLFCIVFFLVKQFIEAIVNFMLLISLFLFPTHVANSVPVVEAEICFVVVRAGLYRNLCFSWSCTETFQAIIAYISKNIIHKNNHLVVVAYVNRIKQKESKNIDSSP